MRRSGGRPTREEAEARDVRLLDVATRLFMERGFDGTSIDAVAEAAGISKPTVYTRYRDKRDLFIAVLRGRIRKWIAPVSAAAEAEATETSPKSIKTTLHELSRHLVAYTLAPEAGALQRILSAQAVQFPELAKLANEEGWLRVVRGVQVFCVSRPPAVISKWTTRNLRLTCSLILCSGTPSASHSTASQPIQRPRSGIERLPLTSS